MKSTILMVSVLMSALMLGAGIGQGADNLYYIGTVNDVSWNFGTVNSVGQTTPIATGLTFGGASAEKLMFAPNGTLYGFDVDGGPWGRINPATGAFTQIGNLSTPFPFGPYNENQGFSLAFTSSGTLYATGIGTDQQYDFGTLNLTTGAFTKIAASPVNAEGSIAAWGNTIYYAGTVNDVSWNFGTVNSAGQTTPIATGLTFGGASAEKLMFAPNGTLYGFDVDGGPWGRINPATGAFTQIGNLSTPFPFGPYNENQGFSLAFTSSGTLYATGIGTDQQYDFGTLNLTTGAFTKIAASPVNAEGSIAAPIPEPSTLVLLGIGISSLLVYGWRRRSACRRGFAMNSKVLMVGVVAAALMLGAGGRARAADNLYYAGLTNGSTYSSGTVTSAGAATTIASGLTFGGAFAEKLMFAPNGTLYGFDVGYPVPGNGSGAWGRINPATGAFSQIGSLYTAFPGIDHTEDYGFSLAFGPSGTLYATGYGTDNQSDFGTLNLTTGAFTKISASPVGPYGLPGSIAAWGNTIYWAGLTNGSTYSFGTVTSAGVTTTIASGLSLGGAFAEKLMFAPDGTLYSFDVGYPVPGNGSGAWGRINPATGAFTQIGSLYTAFPGIDHTEDYGFSLAFGPSGTLYATGYGTDNNSDFGTLNLTTGAFTKISASPVGPYGLPGSIAAFVPEPSTFILLGIGVFTALAFGWRRRTA